MASRSLQHSQKFCQIRGEQEHGMADHSGEVVSGEAIQQAVMTSRTTEQAAEDDQETSPSRGGLVLAALGVVFGDIGTSPVYTFRECFNPEHGLALTQANVLGVLSCLIWALVLVVAVKYVLLIMRADNQGEGGIFALLALALWGAPGKHLPWVLTMLGLAGASLFYGDSMITPAISVLSAVEGLEVAIPGLKPFVLPVTMLVLLGLFVVQKRGTERVGRYFGPVMALWFAVLGILGLIQIGTFPQVVTAISPLHALDFFIAHPAVSIVVLGAVALAITGGEALYADMGHFGRFPIRTAWFSVVMPALVFNYLGQGALVLADKSAIENPFFRLASDWAILPLVVLATAATVIASQAVISGAFADKASDAARPDDAARRAANLGAYIRPDLHPAAQLAASHRRIGAGPRLPKLERARCGLRLCRYRDDGDHDRARAGSGAPHLGMAVACCGGCLPAARAHRSRAVLFQRSQNTERWLVSAGDRDDCIHRDVDLALRAPARLRATLGQVRSLHLFFRDRGRSCRGPRIGHRSLSHEPHRRCAGDDAEQL